MDLNASLLNRHAPIGAGDVRDSATSATASANFETVTVPAEAIGVYISQDIQTQPGILIFLGTGASAPTKASLPAGSQHLAFDNHESTYFYPLDPQNPPTMFVAENGAATAIFYFHFVLAKN